MKKLQPQSEYALCPHLCVFLGLPSHSSRPHGHFKKSAVLCLNGFVAKSVNSRTSEQILSIYVFNY